MSSGPERRAFCIQQHIGAPRGDHIDFLVVDGSALATWAWKIPPGAEPAEFEAERLAEHRLLYLDHEGPVSGDRGRVRPLFRGEAELLVWRSDQVSLELRAPGLSGRIELRARTAPRWRVTWRPCAGSASTPS